MRNVWSDVAGILTLLLRTKVCSTDYDWAFYATPNGPTLETIFAAPFVATIQK
jgi:hypothetical protein